MGNPISDQMKTGTLGELLVQLRLLQFGVQSAAPLKDSGNDLIAVRGEAFRGVQVKTTTTGDFQVRRLPKRYHILALVDLKGEDDQLFLDLSQVFLLSRQIVNARSVPEALHKFAISQKIVDELFREESIPQ
jgi:hypothetical protein